MSDEEVVEKGLHLASQGAHFLQGDVAWFIGRVDVQFAFHFMCHQVGWDVNDADRMDTLSKAAGLMLGIYMADKRNALEEWPVLPDKFDPSGSSSEPRSDSWPQQ